MKAEYVLRVYDGVKIGSWWSLSTTVFLVNATQVGMFNQMQSRGLDNSLF